MTPNSYVNQICSNCSQSMDQFRQRKITICTNCKKAKQKITQAHRKRMKGGNRLWKMLDNKSKI